ncbi:Glutamine--fructose-6-phosphate aminotransferase [isomerizing] [Geodia barretti]|uniref:glutamine--fructose-6-phosphate transaminase (isomerizing) n=4 Tax=Geodia barretti TaxID=519541 RepID=A0AA35X0Z7_GEOBA|nr:Glutamine--fructose-6-phosphate aminotransferase [isomerizing] [Geodia barretti]
MVVHNGIFENYLDLKRELADEGHIFNSQTDAECIPHLIESYMNNGCSLEEATRAAASRIDGANAVVVLSRKEPDKIVSFKLGNAGGIVIGYGESEMLLASDIAALLPHVRTVAYLAVGEMATVTRKRVQYTRIDGSAVKKSTARVSYGALTATKGEYKHFMLKEIHEQPDAVLDTLRGRVQFDPPGITLPDFPFSDDRIRSFNRAIIIGMGTSLHAGMVGRMWIESLAGLACEVDNSSEFRYRDAVLDENTLVISISQSGETADTLGAMDLAKSRGARQLTLCNYEGTQSTRVADGVLPIRAGLEISVAGTKTFVCSLVTLYALAAYLGVKRGYLSEERLANIVQELLHLPEMIGQLLSDQSQYERLALKYGRRANFLFLGRGKNYPLAMEGALKLKEISYIHAEGYPAGEMKHGPISLIDRKMPVVALVPQDDLYEKMLSNVNEVKARRGSVVAVAAEGDKHISEKADEVIWIPKASANITPILNAIPMQLLAYYIAVERGCDVDQPRNLAKSVTVE